MPGYINTIAVQQQRSTAPVAAVAAFDPRPLNLQLQTLQQRIVELERGQTVLNAHQHLPLQEFIQVLDQRLSMIEATLGEEFQKSTNLLETAVKAMRCEYLNELSALKNELQTETTTTAMEESIIITPTTTPALDPDQLPLPPTTGTKVSRLRRRLPQFKLTAPEADKGYHQGTAASTTRTRSRSPAPADHHVAVDIAPC